jgi:Holliday junction resolvase RusA-like endonuclease
MRKGLSFAIPGAPVTKKNHGRVIMRGGRRYHVQSAAHERWNAAAQLWLARIRAVTTGHPFATPVHCRALFYRRAEIGDLVGFQQALGDALQEGRIIQDDRLIASWDGTRLLKDAKNPRIEVEIEEI